MQYLKIINFWIALVLITSCTSLPRIYSGESVHGWVIDSKTEQPIKDVVVVEIWALEGGLHVDHTANIHIAETLTDENGYYSFEDWGPRLTMTGWIMASSPALKFYKFGYLPDWMGNTVSGNPNRDNTVSEHSGKKIELVKFEATTEQYAKILGRFPSFLRLGYSSGPFECMWMQVPIVTSEIIKAKKYFKQRGVYSRLPSFSTLSAPNCRNPEEILKGYLK